jgi:Flp pilus assembly protein TadG
MYHLNRKSKTHPAASLTPRRRWNRNASAAAELAILLPFLTLMFTAAVDFGRAFYVTQTLEACAYAGALYASGTAQTTAAEGQIKAAQNAACASGTSLSPPVESGNVTVNADGAAGTVSVTVAYDFTLLTPLLGSTGPLHLTRTVTLQTAPIPGS